MQTKINGCNRIFATPAAIVNSLKGIGVRAAIPTAKTPYFSNILSTTRTFSLSNKFKSNDLPPFLPRK